MEIENKDRSLETVENLRKKLWCYWREEWTTTLKNIESLQGNQEKILTKREKDQLEEWQNRLCVLWEECFDRDRAHKERLINGTILFSHLLRFGVHLKSPEEALNELRNEMMLSENVWKEMSSEIEEERKKKDE